MDKKTNTMSFCLKVWGPLAAFNRPELKVERVSYDVITPSAARAIFSAVFWKPAIRWHITKIEVLKPIKTLVVRKNEVAALATKGTKGVFIEDKRQQKSGIYLKDVAYRLYADMEYIPPVLRNMKVETEGRGPETPIKYFEMFRRRASKGQVFHQMYFGTRECAANYSFIPEEELEQEQQDNPALDSSFDQDFGIMLYDLDFDRNENNPPALFYRAKMKDGVIIVPDKNSDEVLR